MLLFYLADSNFFYLNKAKVSLAFVISLAVVSKNFIILAKAVTSADTTRTTARVALFILNTLCIA